METVSPQDRFESGTQGLEGARLWLIAILIAAANFVAILDISIANVSVPNISGALGVTPTQGTWVITSYAVAEAIAVPLTGWLAGRYGAVRVFAMSLAGFGLSSALCGLAPTFGCLVAFRVVQGLCGGPLIPLSQTLLMTIFPKRLRATALGVWAVTTILGPIMGPALGGFLCDAFGWGSIFLVNVPIALIAAFLGWRTLAGFETSKRIEPMDVVGLVLLIVWVAALQVMLDLGRSHAWFSSPLIVGLAVTAVIGATYFVIWELTARYPIVDLRIFRYRGYSLGLLVLGLAIGAFFSANIILPLWLQLTMGYTATWAGGAMCLSGLLSLAAAPIAAILMNRMDPRRVVCFALVFLSANAFIWSFTNTDISFAQIGLWLFLSGAGMPMFLLPLISMNLSGVTREETAHAAGLQSFVRTMASAIAISMATTLWENTSNSDHVTLSARLTMTYAPAIQKLVALHGDGVKPARSMALYDLLVQRQAVTLATGHIFQICAGIYALCAVLVWVIPKPKSAGGIGLLH